MTNCYTDWAPSIHHNKWGIKQDHGLVRSTWKWRLREIETPNGVDYSALAIPSGDYARRFNEEFTKYFTESKSDDVIVPPECI